MDALTEWYKQPFKSDMDAKDWLVFIGFLGACGLVWKLALYNMKELST